MSSEAHIGTVFLFGVSHVAALHPSYDFPEMMDDRFIPVHESLRLLPSVAACSSARE